MRWSQLKRRVEQNFAPSLRGRVELFQTVYRRAPDDFGEVWLVVDGERRFSWGEMTAYFAEAATGFASERAGVTDSEREWLRHDALHERGVLFRWQINVLLLRTLSLPIDAALKHQSPLVRGLATLDRRCGKRRLPAIKQSEEHPFVRAMTELRCQAEGMMALIGSGRVSSPPLPHHPACGSAPGGSRPRSTRPT